MKQNIEYGRKRLRKIVENEARQEEEGTKYKNKQTDEDVDLTLTSRRQNWKELKKALWYWITKTGHWWLYWFSQTAYQNVNWELAKEKVVYKGSQDPMGKIVKACKINYYFRHFECGVWRVLSI